MGEPYLLDPAGDSFRRAVADARGGGEAEGRCEVTATRNPRLARAAEIADENRRRLSVSLKGVAPEQAKLRIRIEPGRHLMKVANIEEVVSRNGKPMVLVTLGQTYGPEIYLEDNMVLEGFGLRRLAAFFAAVGVDPDKEDFSRAVGREVDVDVDDRTFGNKVSSAVIAYHRRRRRF